MSKTKTAEELTLRDEFAGIAMAYLMEEGTFNVLMNSILRPKARASMAVMAYRLADAMMEARTKDLSRIPE